MGQRSILVPPTERAPVVMAAMVAEMVMTEMDTIRIQTDNPLVGGARMTHQGAIST